MRKSILFIGGAGFIGSSIIRWLDKEKFHVVVIEPKGAYLGRLDGMDVDLLEGSLCNIELVKEVIEQQDIQIVVHLVSTLIPGSTYEDYKKEYKDVIFPSIELMELCAQKGIRFVYFSSGGTVYGNRNDVLPFTETDAMNPISYYGWSKQMMENSIQFMHRTVGLDYLVVRPSNPYGHGQNLYGKQGLVAVAMGKLLRNEEIEVWGDGSAVRDYIYVDDLARIFVKLIEEDVHNTTLNIGSGRGYSVNDVLAFLKIVTGRELKIVYQNPRPVDVSSMVLDTSRLKGLISYEVTPFMDGIKKYYEEVKENIA
jgi:UDP-glucose 4-epimerase